MNHLPLLLNKERGKTGTLIGHMARSNPHWKSLDSTDCLCIFHGPHGYISPSWYTDPLNVPTWNYAVVHASGRAKVVHDRESALQGVQRHYSKANSQLVSIMTEELSGLR